MGSSEPISRRPRGVAILIRRMGNLPVPADRFFQQIICFGARLLQPGPRRLVETYDSRKRQKTQEAT